VKFPVRFLYSFLFQNITLVYLISEDKLTAVINDECQDGQFIKYIYNHLIQLIILSHRCAVKTLREKVFII
jgi:hypothetical protein